MVVGLFVSGVLLIAAIVGAFVVVGRRPLERASRLTEARVLTKSIAGAIAACATSRGLPESGASGLACSDRAGPEAAATGFRFDWERLSPERGFVRAEGDPTNEHRVRVVLRALVACHGEGTEIRCEPGHVEEVAADER
jgi:hypothetical protein